ncbi:unnamed protein product [Auanema sp. JU1783]|nr:unnamed protein product [Auanema sp. JU1783]
MLALFNLSTIPRGGFIAGGPTRFDGRKKCGFLVGIAGGTGPLYKVYFIANIQTITYRVLFLFGFNKCVEGTTGTLWSKDGRMRCRR